MQSDQYPLPFGWVKNIDPSSGHPFYVDTKVTPPRSIWTHPYEDDVFLKEHPDVREKVKTGRQGGSDSNIPPPSFEQSQRPHSLGGGRPSCSSQQSDRVAGSSRQNHRGRIGMIKDQIFGTKEERKAEKQRKKEEERARKELRRQQDIARQQYYASQQAQYGYAPGGYGVPQGGGFGSNQRGRGGGGSLALPLLGGLAGGLLLGEALDGFGDFGGGFDGGFF